jgi:hypothetical protein
MDLLQSQHMEFLAEEWKRPPPEDSWEYVKYAAWTAD